MPTILLLKGARRRLPEGPSWLRRSDCKLLDAATAEEIVRAVATQGPSLVIVDLEEDPDGALETIRAVRADPAAREVPLLVLAPPDRAEAARDAGAGHVFPGGAPPDEVLTEVRRLVGSFERAAPRVKVEAPIAIWRDGHPTEGRITDLSTSGFFTATNELQPVGARLEISFSLPHDPSGKTVTGEVIVVRRTDAPNSGFGARFFRLPHNASQLIDDYLGPRTKRPET